jgi:hypothetical protein
MNADTAAGFWRYITPGARVIVWTNAAGTSMALVTVVGLNRDSVTVRLASGETRLVPRLAIADLAPGERDRQARLKT